MKSLLHAPLFKLFLSFIAGIWTAKYQLQWPIGIAFFSCLLFVYGVFRERHCLGNRWEWVLAVSVVLVFGGLGNAWYRVQTWSPVDKQVDALVNCRAQLMGKVVSEVKENEFGRRAWLELLAYREDSMIHIARGRFQLYLKPEDTVSFHQGDTLLVQADVRPARSKYPSYLMWLRDHGIKYFAYSKKTIVRHAGFSWENYLSEVQRELGDKLAATFSDSLLAGVAKAMYLGDKQALDGGVRKAFASAGLSHILAISGLHVGIVFLALSLLLAPIHRLPHGLRLKNLIILFALLSYMMITGCSPAVVRAVLMFGTILLFRIFYRPYHILNLLAISAMIQSLVSPEVVFKLGFQLSYLAVLGIVLAMPLFENYFYTSYKWLDRLYSWIGISLIATFCTTPLVWYHFGQFPTYFVVSNVLVSGMVFLIVLTGFLAILFIWLPGLNMVMGYLCEQLLKGLYFLTDMIANWPYALIQTENVWGKGLAILLIELLLTFLILFLPKWVRYYMHRREHIRQQNVPTYSA